MPHTRCGDLLNDCAGIGGHGECRGELSLMLRAVAMRTRRLRPERAPPEGVGGLRSAPDREGRSPGTRVAAEELGVLTLGWEAGA
jgi:hypothetical protein